MVASLAERADLSILKCDVCHMESVVLHLTVNIRLHQTLHKYNRHLQDNRNHKNRKTVKFCHKRCDSTCVPVLLLSSDGNFPVFCLCLEL